MGATKDPCLVYGIAGVLLVAAGIASLLAPSLVLAWEDRRKGNRTATVTDGRIRIVQVSGAGFLLIGLAFLWIAYGDQLL